MWWYSELNWMITHIYTWAYMIFEESKVMNHIQKFIQYSHTWSCIRMGKVMWTHKLMKWYIGPPPSSGLGWYPHKWLLRPATDQIKGNRSVWEREKVNSAITYRNKLGSKKNLLPEVRNGQNS